MNELKKLIEFRIKVLDEMLKEKSMSIEENENRTQELEWVLEKINKIYL